MSTHNTLCWTDIPVLDLDRAIAFYSGVLGREVTKQSMPQCDFGLLPHEDNNASGCLIVSEHGKPSRDGPLVYLSVDGRLDAAVETAKSGGGKILQEKHSIGPHGFRAVIADTEGNRIALHSHTA